MNTQNQERARAIQLLHNLIERSPSDSRSRARLLSLLYANGSQGQFVFEARKYKECCDLSFDSDWVRICDMGLELDPENSLFRVSATQPNARNTNRTIAQELPAEEADGENTNNTISQDRPASGADGEDTDRRAGSNRREKDRRTSFTAWFGKENRIFPQRQKHRRQADVDSYKKR